MTNLRAYLLAKRYLIKTKKFWEERKDDMIGHNAPIENICFVNRRLESVNKELEELMELAIEEDKNNPDKYMFSMFCNEG